MATNGNINHHDHAVAPTQTSEGSASVDGSNSNLPKDEVGWYFVEQYYTTMSKAPERLHLFYGKKAQFVCGREAEVVNVSFGRHSIQERIKGMDFQDCKVRISNVDTQGSEENILITVIGEMANKDGEPKKFVQTFVLAQQPSGYFVLNDMLRYINEDVEEEDPEAVVGSAGPVEMPAAPVAEVKKEAPAAEEAAQPEEAQVDSGAVAEKLEEAIVEAPAAAEASTAEPAAEVQEAAAVQETQPEPDVEKTVDEIAEEEVQKPEEPKDPAPTPAVAPPPARVPAAAPAPAQPEKPKGPPKPMSWASRAAAAAGAPRPVVPIPVPVPKTATPPAQAQPRAPAPAAPQQAAAPAAAAQPQEAAPASTAAKDQGSEWQTAETKRQGRAQPVPAPPLEKDGTMAYIKFVTDKVKDEDLKATLTGFGELAYFDINRQKNCAFVEFKTQAGYTAAFGGNPHTVNGETIVVEPRRPKANAYGGANYNAARGGPSGRGGRGGERHPDISLYCIDITAGVYEWWKGIHWCGME
ncbi:hypothetical protein C8A00DRAFT_12360 [Chaetomidium leptoderma]|uniref:NTF2 domain-containing protein n=1 Tax=Chaetomidium leptoderma TaxID=669021 RepID=A0AAN6VSS4_9PEZI|nr:hypothetical protein C8A00DRAFT_12360 [Chaetomidium leptoderma]